MHDYANHVRPLGTTRVPATLSTKRHSLCLELAKWVYMYRRVVLGLGPTTTNARTREPGRTYQLKQVLQTTETGRTKCFYLILIFSEP